MNRVAVALGALGALALLMVSRGASAASVPYTYPPYSPPGTLPEPLWDEYPYNELPPDTGYPIFVPHPSTPPTVYEPPDDVPPAVYAPPAAIDYSGSYTDDDGYTYYFDVAGNYVGFSDLDGAFYPADWTAPIQETTPGETMPPAPVPIIVEPAADQGEINMQAMLAMIAKAEGTDPNPRGWNPYGVTVGYEFEIVDFSDHPARLGWPGNRLAGVQSNAAGKYQAMKATWNLFIGDVGPRDFSAESQEEFARWAIEVKRRVGHLVRAGRFAEALRYPNLTCEWASLPPGCGYGQPKWSWEQAGAVYAAFGGSFADTDPINVALAQDTGAPLTA